MFEYNHQNILCVHAVWLIESNIVSEPNYKQLCSRGHLKKIQLGGNGRKALIQFDTMRSDIKNKVIELAGDPYAKVSTITFADYIGKTGQIDHPIPVQNDHQFRSKLTTLFRFKLTT